MAYLGDYATSKIVYGKFTTYRPSTGAAYTLGGTPALSVYKDNSTTQSTSGVTLTADFDSVTGLNHFAIDTSSDGTFYSAGSNFDIVITTGTVDSVSVVGAVVGSFTLEKCSPLRPTTAGRTLDVSAGGEGGIDWANVGSPTTAVDLSGTTIKTTQKVDVDTIKTNPVVNGGTITFPTNATLASTTNITAGTITTTTNLTNERSKYMHGAVWIGSAANTNTVNYTDGIMTNPVSTIAAAKTIADSLGLKRFWVQAGVTVTLGADYAGYVWTGYGYTFTTSGSRSISASVIIGAVSVTGTFTGAAAPTFIDCEFGATVTLPASNMHNCEFSGTQTLGTGNYDFIDCASIVAGAGTPVFDCNSPGAAQNISFRRWSGGITINNINSNTIISIDAVSGGTITLNGADGNVQVRGMVSAVTDNRTGAPTLGRNAALNHTLIPDFVLDEALSGHTTAGTLGKAIADIEVDTTEIGVAGAGLTNINLPDQTMNITGNITGNLSGSVGSVTGAVGSVTAGVTLANGAHGGAAATITLQTPIEANAVQISGDATAADRLEASLDGAVTGAAIAGTLSTTQATTNLAEATDDHYNGRLLTWTSGVLVGQQTDITDYTGATKLLTFTALTEAPSANDTFIIT